MIEGTTEVGVIVTRVPEGDRIIDYLISGGVDINLFTIDSSGALSFNVAPDFEDADHSCGICNRGDRSQRWDYSQQDSCKD